MTQYYHPVAPQASRLYGFYILMLVHFMLVHYSIWQRADPQRSSIPFSDIHFLRDFSMQPLKILDPWTCILIGSSLLLVLVVHIIKTNRILVISEHGIVWSLFGHPYRKVCKLIEVQQFEYIAIPPNDQHQMVLLRLHTAAQNYDLNLSQFHVLDQKLIYEQLAQRFSESKF
ncbi:hypothetical protein [Acinetobacter sp. FDAARGOS_724]|uniref:hypothetical protein n=1 Tax=Acinetobacter TaxID=469 RepID=UPI00158A228A|nr:hypothetical protein [Acinetobacter sp. FDAARGOS_724]QKW82192.1 hypothetical protein FOC32_07790 [Acinetobacter sp. FDAARGOS_724]